MPYLNIHWKGYPHHHLPKIRVASTPSVSVRNRSNAAARQVFEVPSGSALDQERKKHRFNFRIRRRRGRSSRNSAATQAKRRASQRAKQNIQVFGWDTSNANLASKATTEADRGSRQSTLRPPEREHPDDIESAIPSTDGAASSIIKRTTRHKKADGLYSLMHVAEPPKQPKSRKLSLESDQLSNGSVRKAGGEYAHTTERPQTYGARNESNTRTGIRASTALPRVKSGSKQQSFSSPEFWEAVNSFALKSKKQRRGSPSIKSIVQSAFSQSSRTPSQKRALHRFTKEIELYLQAARTLPKYSLVPSITATSISADTILDFKPYQSQFQSAGLAVTSGEQRGTVPVQELLTPPPTPPKDDKWEKMAIISRKSKIDPDSSEKKDKGKQPQRGAPSFVSGSTGTTVLEFTPPDEKSYARPQTDRRHPSLESDHSNHATLGSTTPPLTRLPTSEPRPSTKRSLPWLRRNQPSPEVSPTKKMSLAPVERELQPRPSTPLHGWVSTFEITDKSPPIKQESEARLPENRSETLSRHYSASKWRESKISTQRTIPRSTKGKQAAQSPTPFTAADSPKPCQRVNNYVDTSVQVDLPSGDELQSANSSAHIEQRVIKHAPIPTGRNKTFPLTPNKCKGDCDCAPEHGTAAPPPKLSRTVGVTWQNLDNSTQTETMTTPRDENPQQGMETQAKKLSSSSTVQTGDQSPLPLSSRTCLTPNLVRKPPRMRSSNKSIDDTISQPVQSRENTEKELPTPPSRRPPSPPPVCGQCASPIDTALDVPKEPGFELDYKTETLPKPSPAHARHSRSSLLCQQCFPSRQTSLDVSPMQANLPVVASYHSSVRRSTRPIIPSGPMTYLQDPPLRAEQLTPRLKTCLDSAEGKNTHKQIIQETIEEFAKQSRIADPMKKPSVAKTNVKAPPKQQPAPIYIQPLSTLARAKPVSLPMPKQKPLLIATACPLDHVDSSSVSLDLIPPKSGQVTDKQVFRGLHVATAAACDDDVDKWIEEITGTGVRKFLADLSAFEGLGFNTLANVAKRAARQRRGQLRAWEQVRERRLAAQSREAEAEKGEPRMEGEEKDVLKVQEFIISDQGVIWRGEDEEEEYREGSQEGDGMIGDQRVEAGQKRQVEDTTHRRDYR